jgi:hypothetical protein
MNHYRLLRDNKESGPYSQEEIIARGFKPYDLIWVEGKSAGWRYPSEIAELKTYAPVVEEQPYDRFFKKPSPQKAGITEERSNGVSFASTIAKKEERPTTVPAIEPLYTMQPPAGRHIHVTLPSGNRVNLTTITSKKEAVEERVSYPAPAEERSVSFTETISQAYSVPVKETKTVIKETGERIKETFPVGSYAYSTRPNPGFSWTLVMGLVLGIATLVGLGIMIGLSINREKNDLAFNAAIAKKSKQIVAGPGNSSSQVPVAKEEKIADNQNTVPVPAPEENKNLVRNAVIRNTVPPVPVSTGKEENKRTVNKPEEVANNVPVSSEAAVVAKKPEILPPFHLEKHLNLTTNEYKVGAFGGISDLQCTVVNDSKFAVEDVEVEVQYIQANDKVFKTEKLLFKDIPAGGQITLSAPKSSRGIKVVGKIIKINSKESGLSNTTVKS